MAPVEATVTCPYNAAHHIIASRYPAHLIKCRKQHPNQVMKRCPFDKTHDVPAPEFSYHVSNCPSKINLERELYHVGPPDDNEEKLRTFKPAPKPLFDDPSQEDWDEQPQACGSYLDYKDLIAESQKILRLPVGKTKAERRDFFLAEQQRFSEMEESKRKPQVQVKPSTSRYAQEEHDELLSSGFSTMSMGLGRGSRPVARGGVGGGRGRGGGEEEEEEEDEDGFQLVIRNKGRGRGLQRDH